MLGDTTTLWMRSRRVSSTFDLYSRPQGQLVAAEGTACRKVGREVAAIDRIQRGTLANIRKKNRARAGRCRAWLVPMFDR